MPKAKQLTVWVQDRPGILGEVAGALAPKKVNIQAFAAYVIQNRGAIRLIVDEPASAKKVFAQCGWKCTEETVVVVTLADKPGSLGAVASKLGKAGINIQYAYTGGAKAGGKVNTYFAVANVATALKRLRSS